MYALPCFVDIGADVVHPVEAPPIGNVTIAQAKAVFRGKVTVEGNIQIGDLYECDAQEIRRQAEELLRDGFDDQEGLIVSATASPYIPEMGDKMLENYRAIIEVVKGR